MIGEAVDRAADRVTERVQEVVRNYALKIAFFVIACALLIGVIVVGCIAVFWALEPEFGRMASLAIIAGTLFVASIAFAIAARSMSEEVSIVDTVKPAQVVEEETDEIVDTMGPYKFVAAALAAGVMLGGGLAGSRRSSEPSTATSGGSLLSMLPTLMSAMSTLNSYLTTETSRKPKAGASEV